jgi:hypothetical protein
MVLTKDAGMALLAYVLTMHCRESPQFCRILNLTKPPNQPHMVGVGIPSLAASFYRRVRKRKPSDNDSSCHLRMHQPHYHTVSLASTSSSPVLPNKRIQETQNLHESYPMTCTDLVTAPRAEPPENLQTRILDKHSTNSNRVPENLPGISGRALLQKCIADIEVRTISER